MLPCCSMLQKYSLLICNLVFALTGALVIGVSLWGKGSIDMYEHWIELTYFPEVILCVGCFVFIVAFFGFCGSLMENRCMLLTFSIMMVVIFVSEVLISCIAYWYRDDTSAIVAESMENYGKDPDITNVWDVLQTDLNCCGARTTDDWAPFFNGSIPISCCTAPGEMGPVSIGVIRCTQKSPTFHDQNCLYAMSEYLMLIVYTGIGAAVLQLLSVIFSCNVAHSIRKIRLAKNQPPEPEDYQRNYIYYRV